MSTLGSAYNEYIGSCLRQVQWILLAMGTVGPAYNGDNGSHLQRVPWVPLKMNTMGPAYNECGGFCLQQVKRCKGESARCKRLVTDAKKSVRCKRVLVLAELEKSGT